MPKKSKKFLDKNSAQSFNLVHRSQRDAFIGTDAGNLVLAPVDAPKPKGPKERLEEQQKFGIYYDDDYDYLQHLRDVNEVTFSEPVEDRFRVSASGHVQDPNRGDAGSSSKLVIPSSVLESGIELEMPLLDRVIARPGPNVDWDPDIVAALDDDFNFDDPENQLEDDFMQMANVGGPCQSRTADDSGNADSDNDDNMEPSDGSGSEYSETISEANDDGEYGMDEETRSQFTNYSLTSSVIRRTEGLKLLDQAFEKIYEGYEEDEIGDLEGEHETIGGYIEPSSVRMQQMVDEYHSDVAAKTSAFMNLLNDKTEVTTTRVDVDDSQWVDVEDEEGAQQAQQKWDCESIISTYSNLYNHPALIKEPPNTTTRLHLTQRGIPANVFSGEGLTPSNLKKLPDAVMDGAAVHTKITHARRPPDETPEQRRMRKQALRQQRQERRVEKKTNKIAFKCEEKKYSATKIAAAQNTGLKMF